VAARRRRLSRARNVMEVMKRRRLGRQREDLKDVREPVERDQGVKCSTTDYTFVSPVARVILRLRAADTGRRTSPPSGGLWRRAFCGEGHQQACLAECRWTHWTARVPCPLESQPLRRPGDRVVWSADCDALQRPHHATVTKGWIAAPEGRGRERSRTYSHARQGACLRVAGVRHAKRCAMPLAEHACR
jgi:hypothetical protein